MFLSMARTPATVKTVELILVLSLRLLSAFCSSFTISNNCQQTIWPATLAGAGTPQLPTTGFRLDPGQSVRVPAVPGWSGRIWARTGCKFDDVGMGRCETGDCAGKMECSGLGASPPTTLFEVTLGKEGSDDDFYDVSVVDGFNLPLVAAPRVVTTNASCAAAGCVADLNSGCPRELQVIGGGIEEVGGTSVVACKSACEAFGLARYCCSGEFASPTTCNPSFYSAMFKTACPRAYSYAFDDGTSTFTCKASEYYITFCPTINGLKKSGDLPTSQPAQDKSNGDEPQQAVSSANVMVVSIYSLLLLALFC